MPILGIGTSNFSNAQAEELVYYALDGGFKPIDTARI